MKSGMMKLKEAFTASQYGGAPLLGLSKTVIKAHGSSDARAIVNAIRQAEAFVQTGVIAEMESRMQAYTVPRKARTHSDGGAENGAAEKSGNPDVVKE